MKRNGGYTMIEVVITLGLTAILVAATGGVLVNAARAADQNDDRTTLSASMRAAEERLYVELAQASFDGDAAAAPAVSPLVLNANPGNSISFQRPLDVAGANWTPLTTYRLRNEDTDGDLLLDDAEDADENGMLDRVIERLIDLDGDGLLTNAGEVLTVATDIDNLTFSEDNGLVTVTMVGRRRIGDSGGQVFQSDSLSFTVNISN